MKNADIFVREASNFLGKGLLVGSTRAAFERCEKLDDAMLIVPACTRKYAQCLMDKVGLVITPESLYFVCLGILGDTGFADCAHKFPDELANKLSALEGLLYGD
jgi:hypothetical protein